MNEINEKMTAIMRRETETLREIYKFAKTLEPVLRDANLNHQADRLLVVLDKQEQVQRDLTSLIESDPAVFLEVLLSRMSGRSE